MNRMLWRYGDLNVVYAAVDAETVIEQGDLLFQETDDARPCPRVGTQRVWFAEKFLGVALQRSRLGDTEPIRVGTTGVFEFDCLPSRFELGDLIAPIGPQQIILARAPHFAIARVAGRRDFEAETVLIAIQSAIMTGGIC